MLRIIPKLPRACCTVIQPSQHNFQRAFSNADSASEVKIPVPWGHVAGKWWGDKNKRPILALHGWLDNAATYDRLAPLLPQDWSLLAIDLPGHGQSSHLPRGMYYHLLESLILMRRIVQHFGWSTVSLMGHSMGGGICFSYSSFYPTEVDAVALIDTLVPLPPPDKSIATKGGKIVDKFLERAAYPEGTSPAYPYDKLLKLVVQAMNGSVTEEEAKLLLERGATKTASGDYYLTSDPRLKDVRLSGFTLSGAQDMATNLKTNFLCVKAESAPYFVPKEWFDSTWEIIKKSAVTADLRMVPGGHHVHLQNPEVVAPIICDFFQKYSSR